MKKHTYWELEVEYGRKRRTVLVEAPSLRAALILVHENWSDSGTVISGWKSSLDRVRIYKENK